MSTLELLSRIEDEYSATGDLGITTLQMIRGAIEELQQAQTAPKGFDAEFLSKRLARVAKLTGVPMPDMTHEQTAEVAGTILGQIASKLEAAQTAPVTVPEWFKLVDERELLKIKHALESCDAGDYSTGSVIHPSYDEKAVEDALNSVTVMLSAAPSAPIQANSEDAEEQERARLLSQAKKDVATVLRVEGLDLEIGSRKLLKEVISALDAATAQQKESKGGETAHGL